MGQGHDSGSCVRTPAGPSGRRVAGRSIGGLIIGVRPAPWATGFADEECAHTPWAAIELGRRPADHATRVHGRPVSAHCRDTTT